MGGENDRIGWVVSAVTRTLLRPLRARLKSFADMILAAKDERARKLQAQLEEKDREISDLREKLIQRAAGEETGRVKPENVIWIFGTGRSGSTWLRRMMSEIDQHEVWEEPLVGKLFGEFYDKVGEAHLNRSDFVMADMTRGGWTRSIRDFVLDGAGYANPLLGPQDYLVVKEPNGSVGAPLLAGALPESRLVLLIRDPRDVVASALDGAKEGNWLDKWRNEAGARRREGSDEDPDAFARQRANLYVRQAGSAKQAYDAHRGRKSIVRYEDLRADTPGTVRRMYAELGIAVEEQQLAAAVAKHAWENIPEDKKGEGKFYRKAKPGAWREDLTPRQVSQVERITEPLLKEFYPGESS